MKNLLKNPAQVNVLKTQQYSTLSGGGLALVTGDVKSAEKKIAKLNLNGLKNVDMKPRLEFMYAKDLVPLDSQRETKSTWAVDRLKACGGLDLGAFGALSVALDPDDGQYRVWDGCGRLTIAKFSGYDEPLPCNVYDMRKEEAAKWFAYNQSAGRRKLSNEAIFVNAFIGRDKATIKEAAILEQLGCYIQVNDSEFGVVNPGAREKGYPKILVRGLQEGYKLSKNDISICRQARDLIVNLWDLTENDQIVSELFFAIIALFGAIPETRSGKINVALKEFLRGIAGMFHQADASKEWKGKELKGISGNIGVAKQLAHALATNFLNSKHGKSLSPTLKRIVNVEKIIPKNTIAD